METRKIVIISDAAAPQVNGVVRTIEATIKHLRMRGFDVTLIEPSYFRTIPCPTYPEISLAWNIWRVGHMIEEINPTYIHISTEGSLGFAAKVWADRRRFPYTTSYHTRYPEYFVDYFGRGLSLGYKLIRWFHRRSTSVMVNTEAMRQLLESHGLTNLSLWGRGVDTDLFQPEGMTAEMLGALPRPILMNVGRVAIEKNLPAFYALPGTKVQVGGGPMLEEYRTQYPDVHFVGSKVGEELASYYRGADVFVFPSKSDTYGLVMLESIASGVPVAAFPVDGPRDVIVDGLVGSLNDDLEIAVHNALHMRGSHLREWALTKSWAACTDSFVKNLIAI